uniref:Uncharacterized protein n=1 Tax=Arion vulgaris TaxID=1028688 RepID=A0A0B7BUH7_9EUPU
MIQNCRLSWLCRNETKMSARENIIGQYSKVKNDAFKDALIVQTCQDNEIQTSAEQNRAARDKIMEKYNQMTTTSFRIA